MNPINPGFSPYGYQPYNPMLTPQQRLAEMEQQYPQFASNQNQMNPMNNMNQNQQMQQSGMMMNQNFVKCRAVTSEDEARAAMIDADGSLHVFTDIGNKKIYTKQINLDGTATLNIYELKGQNEPKTEPQAEQKEEIDLSVYVQQKDLETVCQAFNMQIDSLEDRLKGYDMALQQLTEKQNKGGSKK